MSEGFRVESGVRQDYIMSPWLFNVYMDGVMKGENGDGEEGIEWRLSEPLYAEWVLCSELEDDFKMNMGYFVEACRREGLSESQCRLEEGDSVR